MTEIMGGYVNHADAQRDGDGNLYSVITQDGAGSGDLDVIVKRCDAAAEPLDAASWREVARFTEHECGKHGYGSGVVRNNGDFVAVLSERNAAGQTVCRVRLVPQLCAPFAPSSSGGAGGMIYVPAPNGYTRVKSATNLPHGYQETVALSSYNIPQAQLLNLRVCVSAPAAGARGRAGASAASSGALMLTCVAAAPKVRVYVEGLHPPSEQNTLSLWADNGALDELYVDVYGWWY